MTSGTIAFNTGLKLGFARLGASYFAEGDWITTVEKTSPVHVKASYRVHKLRGLSKGGSVSRASLSLNNMTKFSDLLTYEFNLQNKAGLMAYHHFLKGDLLKAREIYLKLMGIDAFKGKKQYTTSVKMIKKTKSFSEEDYLSAGITIPFLISAKRKSGTNFQLSNFQELRKNVIGTNYIGIFKEKSKTNENKIKNIIFIIKSISFIIN